MKHGFDIEDQAASVTKTARTGKRDKGKPEDYFRRVGDLEDGGDIIATLTARAQAAADFRVPFEEEWRNAYLAWHQVLQSKDKGDKWKSKRFIPMIFQHIESAHPALMSAVFGGKKIWHLDSETPDGHDQAEALDALCHWAAQGPSRMKTAYEKALWWSLCIGTGYLDHQWAYETELRGIMKIEEDTDEDDNPIDAKTGNPIMPGDPRLDDDVRGDNVRKVKVEGEELVTVLDQPIITSINPFDVWACPSAERGDNGDWYFFKHETTPEKIIEAAASGQTFFDEEAVEAWWEEYSKMPSDSWTEFAGAENLNFHVYDDLLEEAGYRARDDHDRTQDMVASGMPVYLLIYRSKSECIAIAPGWKIIGYSENPYIHGKTGIVVHQYYPIDGCPYGRGLGGVLLPHQDLVNENVNRAMDVAEISAMAPIGVDRSRVSVLDDNFRWKPNSLIRTRGSPREAIARLELPDQNNLAMQWDAHLKRDADDTTGVAEQARGNAPSGVNTATEFSGLQANIKTRTFMHVERLKETVALSGDLLIQLFQQYMTKPQVVSILGEEGLYYKEVSHLEILGKFRVRVDISPTALAPAMRVQQMIAVTQVIVPLIQQGMVNPFFMAWVRMLLEEIDVPNLERFFPKNMTTVRDPLMENEALKRGVKVPASIYDPHAIHIQHHSTLIEELQQEIADGNADEGDLAAAMEHIQDHFQKAAQAQGGGAGAGGPTAQPGAGAPPSAPQGGGPQRQEAGAQSMAQGAGGTPGAASPGPQGAPGRAN